MTNNRANLPAIAVALHYDGEAAPRVTASGRGEVAEAIQKIADAHGIPHWENPELAMALSSVDVGTEIPAILYRAVAEVIAFAYLLSGRAGPRTRNDAP